MKKTLLNYLAAMIFATSVGGVVVAASSPMSPAAYSAVDCAKKSKLLTFPNWFRGLTDDNCNIVNPNAVGGISNFIWRIALNIIEIVLQLIGYIAVGFVIFGGYRYMISAGSPDGMVKARKTITNALIGLVISLFSVGIVNLVAGAFK